MAINYKKEIIIRSIKILDIGYITIIYVILGITLAKISDRYLSTFDEKKEAKKPIRQSVLELILYIWLIGIVIYVVRNIVPLIPFPLDGIYGFEHSRVKEVTSAATFSIMFIYFQEHYQEKIKYIYSKINL